MNPKPAEHTPTPWIRRESKSDVIWIEDGNGRVVMHNSSVKDPEDQANAAFIVRAVNAHEELVEALREIAKGAGPYSQDQLEHATNTIQAMKDLANEAIAEQWGNA